MNELQPLDCKSSRAEKYVKLGTAFVSSLGPIGTLIGTIIDDSISSAQQSRIIDFANELYALYQKQNSELQNLKEMFERLLSDNANTLLFEVAAKAAINTNSNMLHHCYAYYIFNNLNNKSMDNIQREKLLRVISELNEYEIIHLINFSIPSYLGEQDSFFTHHEEILMRHSVYVGAPDEDIEFNAFYDQYNVTLEQKGLVFGTPEVKNGKIDFDKKKYKITQFGRLVVEAIYDEDFFRKTGDTA